MRCEQCKGFIVKDSKFCQKCGSPQTETVAKNVAKSIPKIPKMEKTIKTVSAPVEEPEEDSAQEVPKLLYEGQDDGDVDEVPQIEEPEEPEEGLEEDQDTLILKRIDTLEKDMAMIKDNDLQKIQKTIQRTDQELGWVIQNLINIVKPYQKKADKPGGAS